MAKIKLALQDNQNIFLYMTRVENLFISEFLPDAPGDYVKVFLLGLMYAQYDQVMTSHELAMRLGLREDEVEEAWIYWESAGTVRRRMTIEDGDEVCRIEFISQVEALFGRTDEPAEIPAAEAGAGTSETEAGAFGAADEEAAEAAENEVNMYMSLDDMDYDDAVSNKLTDMRLRELYTKYQEVTGRTISRRETGKIADAIRDYGIEPEIFDFAIDYCADLDKYSIDYIFKVALRWTEENCRSVDEVRRLLDKHSLRNSWYSQVFRELGFNRPPAPADREIMDRWFDEMKFSIAEVLDACRTTAGMRDPNLRYVNKVLENRMLEKGGVNTRQINSGAQAGSQGPQGQKSKPASALDDGGSRVSRKVLSDYYEFIRAQEEEYRLARTEEVTAKLPQMKEMLEAESRLNAKLLSIMPGEAGRDARQQLRVKRLELDDSKKQLLRENGYPEDYLDLHYRCGTCKDTGYTDEGMVCSCAKQRAEEAYKWYGDKNSR